MWFCRFQRNRRGCQHRWRVPPSLSRLCLTAAAHRIPHCCSTSTLIAASRSILTLLLARWCWHRFALCCCCCWGRLAGWVGFCLVVPSKFILLKQMLRCRQQKLRLALLGVEGLLAKEVPRPKDLVGDLLRAKLLVQLLHGRVALEHLGDLGGALLGVERLGEGVVGSLVRRIVGVGHGCLAKSRKLGADSRLLHHSHPADGLVGSLDLHPLGGGGRLGLGLWGGLLVAKLALNDGRGIVLDLRGKLSQISLVHFPQLLGFVLQSVQPPAHHVPATRRRRFLPSIVIAYQLGSDPVHRK
mmetsp:Transcript_45068/g.112984  ORF Transcript_45068/g.112984 Transcript_45068/m.112984 type:complete len:299 (-) Transcript_45068:45-941(-)